MNVQIIRGSEVNRPDTTPLGSSVLDHATVVEKPDFGLRNNEGLWPSYNCLNTLHPTPICPDPLGEGKTFDFAGWIPGFEFALQGGVQCKAVGLDVADQRSEIERVFRLNEGKGIELALLDNRFVELAESGSTIGWDAPVDLTTTGPSGILALIVALASLEGYAATVYAGVPTIHMPRAAATLLDLHLVWVDGKAYTKNGSKVAIGGGYDTDAVPDGTYTLYATGEVYVERSEEISIQSYVLPGDGSGTGSGDNGLSDNTVISMVERMYRAAVDCFVAKATATVWS